MHGWIKAALAVATAALAIGLFIAFRPGGDEESATTLPTAAPTEVPGTTDETTDVETGETTTESSAATTMQEAPQPQRIVITVRDGRPVGGLLRAEVAEGAQVLLIVRSDVEDEAHLHGYDLAVHVVPGQPGRIRFRADLPGRFELELEERGVPLAELEVHP